MNRLRRLQQPCPLRERSLAEPRKGNGHNRQMLAKVVSKVESKRRPSPGGPDAPAAPPAALRDPGCRPRSPGGRDTQ